MAKGPKHIKVRLTNQGEDSETPWADDLGPAPGHPKGSRLARLINVPFLHAKPTWGDTLVVVPVDDDFPTWDRNGIPFENVATRIHADGGRWAMIVDYDPHPDAAADTKVAFTELARACAEHDVVCEGAWGARDGRPGRAYLALRESLSDADLMKRLRDSELPCELIQIHPEPPTPKPKPKKKPTARKPAAKKRPAATSKRAAKSPSRARR